MKKKILIVDDQVINRRILKKILENEYLVEEAADGQEALSTLEEQGNDIAAVLLDLIMPVLDGYGVLERKAQNALIASIPVIVVSQEDKYETEERALQLGARDFVSKPYRATVLCQRLRNLIELHESSMRIDRIERDALTGLYNKEGFSHRVHAILRENPKEEYLLVATDVEKFKLVNDSYGEKEGDKLLKYIARRMKAQMQRVGGICARRNADHFIALVPKSVGENNFKDVMDTIEKDLEKYPLNMRIILKMGVYPVKSQRMSVNKMCDRAILAAASIKGQYGTTCAYYDDSVRQKLLMEQQITNEMKTALEEGQFHVYMQPKYDLNSERVAGAEALVRWIHPTMGFMNPGQFIPLFEQNGFITELDQYVWNKTCEIIADWIARGNKYVPVSVNVSRKDIYMDNLPQRLSDIVKSHGLRPNQLHLEITESAYTENADQVIGVVRQLKDVGFTIEMDDFGSGYSSLNMLSELPIDILKLDMRFIQKETEKNSSRNILSFIISLAKWMNLLVVAEGVETRQQVELLRNMDCNYVQGYYFAKPMPHPEFEALVFDSDLAEPIKVQDRDWSVGTIIEREGSGENTMLIVDDIEMNRSILAEYFQDAYTIVEADNGEIAYEYIKKHYESITIIMLDLIMPVMDGFQVLERLRKDEAYRNIPVIVTSQAGESSEARAFELGASDFLSKPYNIDIAIHRVQNVTARNAIQTIDREKKMIKKMRKLAQEVKRDQLTGLYNRMELETQVRDYLEQSQDKGSVFIMLDIDNFKMVNDTFGHGCGDDAIQTVADILQQHFREDDLVCRMGGDEFAVFLKMDTDVLQITRRLETLCRKLQFKIQDMDITCSLGASIAPEHGDSYQELYHNADIALLTAKRLGKKQFQVFGGAAELPEQLLYRNMDWLLDESSDAVFVCDIENYELYYMNEKARAMTGKERKDCMGRPCYEAIWNRSTPCAHCIHLEELTREYCEHEVQPDGTDAYYIIKGKRIKWGSRAARIQYVQDNTRRAMLLKEMGKLSEDRRLLLDLLPGGVLRYDAVTEQFNFVSKNMLHMLGYTRKEFLDKFHNKFSEMVWKEDRARVIEAIRAQIKVGVYDTCEYRIEKKDGMLCSVYDAGYYHSTKTGGEYYVVIMDVTEQRVLQQQVAEQRDMLAAALQHNGMHSWIYDLKHNKIAFSSQEEDNLGVPQILCNAPQSWFDLHIMDEKYNTAVSDMLDNMRSGVNSTVLDVEIVKPSDKKHSWQRVMHTVIRWDKNGNPVKAIGTSHDITEQRIAEQRYAEETAYLNTLTSSLVSSHRLNLTTGVVEESHSTLHIIKNPMGEVFTDENFRRICEAVIPNAQMAEQCYEKFCPSQLKRDYANGITENKFEYETIINDGKDTCWLDMRLKLMRKPSSGELIAFFTFWNVDEEKKLQQVLDALIKTEFDVIFMINAQTGEPKVLQGLQLDTVLQKQRELKSPSAGVAAHLQEVCVSEELERTRHETSMECIHKVLEESPLHRVMYHARTPEGICLRKIDYQYLGQDKRWILCTIQNYRDL
ncbi:MAG: EAL domain-containing protein [Lachnospiraceae bacterium]|nr:EAL domain-containing protein [Lachnospiraceae bacterium]